MDIQEKIAYFAPEIGKIYKKDLQEALTRFLTEEVPEYFWTTAASSSGRYHPTISLGEGGLIRHTKAVAQMAIKITELYSFGEAPNQVLLDTVIVASILHDSFKYGKTGPHTEEGATAFKNHGQIAASAWENFCYRHDYVFLNPIEKAIKSHMSKWGGTHFTKMTLPEEQIVCLADYVTSQKFLDFPELHEKN